MTVSSASRMFAGSMAIAVSLLTVHTPPPARAIESPTLASRSAPAAPMIRVVDQNVEQKPEAIASVVSGAINQSADAILMQEVCASSVTTLRTDYPSWTIAYKPDHGVCRVGGGTAGNVAIWTGGSNGAAGPSLTFQAQTLLPNRGIQSESNIVCVQFQDRYKACSTHIVAQNPDVQRDQAAEIEPFFATPGRNWIENDRTIVLGGDFNMTPDRAGMNSIYINGTGGSGYFREAHRTPSGTVCRCGASTITDPAAPERKIDYVFISSNVVGPSSDSSLSISTNYPTASDTRNSDHRVLSAVTQLTR